MQIYEDWSYGFILRLPAMVCPCMCLFNMTVLNKSQLSSTYFDVKLIVRYSHSSLPDELSGVWAVCSTWLQCSPGGGRTPAGSSLPRSLW